MAWICFVTVVAFASPAHAQATIVIGRIAVKDGATFRYAQLFHDTGKWVVPDIGYIDYGSTDYREFFAGFGRTLVQSPKLTLLGELYYLQASGGHSASEKYVLPWALIAYRPRTTIRSEAVMFRYVPLTRSATPQNVLERAKVEYAWPRFRAGAGYGAYQRRGSEWQHKPFATMTAVVPRVGDLELWIERVASRGAQVQLRFLRVVR